MNSVDPVLRRNFMVAAVMHVLIVGGIIAWETFAPQNLNRTPSMVELIVPADILGELPKGPGFGKGAYTPPPRQPDAPSHSFGGVAAGGPDDPLPSDESPAPVPAPAPVRSTVTAPKANASEIGIPRKTPPPKTATAPKSAGKASATKTTAAASKTKSVTSAKAGSGTSTGATGGRSADQIRRDFMRALGGAATGGTPYGDGTVAGGGSGRSNVIGSPDGSPDGMPGGVGPGSPHWQYYVHVHDKMYQAWEQPGSIRDRGLIAVVQIKVARDGSIIEATLKKSSGNRLMDESALEAARKVKLLEPPPAPLVKGTTAEISIDFEMEG